jgi:sucrose phosphorylase
MIPETFEFIDTMSEWCRSRNLEVLVEVHSYYKRQIEIAEQVDRVYDFALPPLTLFALITGNPEPLSKWLDVRPTNAITVLDTHDGIGVIDVGPDANDRTQPGLLTPEQIDELVESMHDNARGTSRLATGAAASNLDLYQVNSTYYEALGQDDAKYLAARAIQFFTPGIPQVYYVGLFAGINDMELLERSGVGRDVNRHYYSEPEIDQALARPVVQELCELIRLRNTHPAFNGEFTSSHSGSELTMSWTLGSDAVSLTVDTVTGELTITQ